jgi:integrase
MTIARGFARYLADLDTRAEVPPAGLIARRLETRRHNTTRTRNLRLTAIRSLFTYAALRHPEHAALIQQVLATPAKRSGKQLITFLTQTEIDALLAACDLTRWEGCRDRALLLAAAQTGLRVSELTGLTCGDVTLGTGTGASVRCLGRGRKHRAVPLTHPHPGSAAHLDDRTRRTTRPAAIPHPRRTAPQRRRRPAPGPPARHCRRPPLPVDPAGQAAPHTLRHSCAMTLLHAGVDTAVIALGSVILTSGPPTPTCTPTWPLSRSPRPHQPRLHTAETLPPRGPTAGLPGKLVTMPSTTNPGYPQKPALPSAFASRCTSLGIVPGSV